MDKWTKDIRIIEPSDQNAGWRYWSAQKPRRRAKIYTTYISLAYDEDYTSYYCEDCGDAHYLWKCPVCEGDNSAYSLGSDTCVSCEADVMLEGY
jgi:predicted RNA-binding Zn-ribbon protein involved in translation (DUF1610 family)